jgi:cell shape-determining protein MreC
METLKQLINDKTALLKKRDRLQLELKKYKAILSATQDYMRENGIRTPKILLKFVKTRSKKGRPSHTRVLAVATPRNPSNCF